MSYVILNLHDCMTSYRSNNIIGFTSFLTPSSASVPARIQDRMSSGNSPSSFFKVLIGDFRTKLCLPKAFIQNFNGKLPKKISLESPTGIPWMVSVNEADNDVFLWDEWTAFVNDHGLEFGDFLVFRWAARLGFHVKIFGKNGCEKEVPLPLAMQTNTKSLSSEEHQDGEAAVANKMASTHTMPNQIPVNTDVPFSFSCTFLHYEIYQLYVPRYVVKEKGLREKESVVLLDPSGKSWTVKLTHSANGNIHFGAGWLDFCVENRLDTNDTLTFIFVQGKADAIRVEISRRSANEVGEISQRPPYISHHINQETTCTQVGIMRSENETAKQDRDIDNPSFSIVMRPTYVHRPFFLFLPVPFSKKYLKDTPRDITLRDSNGGTWSVRYNFAKRAALGKGWCAFVRDKNLKEKDVCVFELVDRDNIEMKVSITHV